MKMDYLNTAAPFTNTIHNIFKFFTQPSKMYYNDIVVFNLPPMVNPFQLWRLK